MQEDEQSFESLSYDSFAPDEEQEELRGEKRKRRPDDEPNWKCEDCGFTNKGKYKNVKCFRCAKPKPEDEFALKQAEDAAVARVMKKQKVDSEEEKLLKIPLKEAEEFLEETITTTTVLTKYVERLKERNQTLDYLTELEEIAAARFNENNTDELLKVGVAVLETCGELC
eukprot:TRINITY_DN3821_c4_g1_i1.p1 TRINITY_DN3821_c4_g1~~TRINITY_DN3821_c4_g1_i1.p1  ORF type:complete len:186 (+),score=68.96 TRINITY_DN3821_c4_g1_i1:51-560(+)